ncbi:phage major capsid protein [Candidatus Bathyarchaeota archaeon]|nr:phage major capsid protein [Candidatus Bathyarchaeota archaeon]
MALPSITAEKFDDLHTSTWFRKKKDVVDNIFDAIPIFKVMKSKGLFVDLSGGTDIIQPLEYGENSTVSWIGHGSRFDLEQDEIITAAKYDWKWIGGSVVRYFTNESLNKGEAALFNYTEKNIKNLNKTLKKELNSALLNDGSQATLAMEGFKKYVQSTPATGTVGGIDASTNSWWRNQHTAMTGLDHTVYLIDYMRTMYDDCSDDGGTDTPQMLVTTKAIKNWYEDEALDSHYYTESNEMADLGIKGCAFKGAPIIWSDTCDAGLMYFLNLNYFEMAYDPSKWFEMTEWKTAQDNLERVAQVVAQLNLICSNREKQGLLSAITT